MAGRVSRGLSLLHDLHRLRTPDKASSEAHPGSVEAEELHQDTRIEAYEREGEGRLLSTQRAPYAHKPFKALFQAIDWDIVPSEGRALLLPLSQLCRRVLFLSRSR